MAVEPPYHGHASQPQGGKPLWLQPATGTGPKTNKTARPFAPDGPTGMGGGAQHSTGEKLNRRQMAEQRRKLEQEQQSRTKPEIDIFDEQGTPIINRKRPDPVGLEESAKSIPWPSKVQARQEPTRQAAKV